MLNLVFSLQKGCQYIFRKTGYYNINILQEIATTWEKHLEMKINYDDIKTSINLMKWVTRNMYLYDIQSKVWQSRIVTNTTLCKMGVRVADTCEFCGERENNSTCLSVF